MNSTVHAHSTHTINLEVVIKLSEHQTAIRCPRRVPSLPLPPSPPTNQMCLYLSEVKGHRERGRPTPDASLLFG